LADKGTLFMDEIGELPLELQPKLLRVLQDREFERLGGIHTLHVDVRILSANQPRFAAGYCRPEISRRSVLPAECISHPVAPVARATL